MEKAIFFSRKLNVYPEFSNFHNAPVKLDEFTYKNNEAAFQSY